MSERVQVGGLRTLGAPTSKRQAAPKRTKAQAALSEQAVKTLKAEFRKALALKQKLAGEAVSSGEAKGRDPNLADKLRSIVASLEGMSRFAIAMGLITPAENRALFGAAIKKGLYQGWSR
ncbi:MAG: hypothetical protein ACRDJM_05690 [Actinomycetota bacterium]